MWEAKLEPNVISYNARISACEKGEQWQRALLLCVMREVKEVPNAARYIPAIVALLRRHDTRYRLVSFNAGTSTNNKGEQWQRSMSLLSLGPPRHQ